MASYGQWRQNGAIDNDNNNGDGTTDNDGNGATDNNDDNDDDGNDTDGAAADNDNVDDVDNIDNDNLPPRVGKRNDGCDKTKTKEEETVGNTHNNQTDYREGGGRWQQIRRRRR